MFKGQQETNYKVAIYCRLSKDDGNTGDSTSIESQKQMLTKHVKEQGWIIQDYFVDDGFSGLNFNRPEFKRMIGDIEKGNINLVITKDLSRFGRNYLESGTFLEMFFPEKGVRYIALNDGVDTIDNANMDITPFKNILNEMYSKDISKKVKTGLRARLLQGKFIATNAPYGYIKDPEDKSHLIINEEVASVVRMIFDYGKNGLGISLIRQKMNEEKVLRPAAYASSKGKNYHRYFENSAENRYIWSNNSIRGILRNPVYAGHLVGNKRPSTSLKSKKRAVVPMEDWVIVKNCHEPIINPDEFELVQKLITSRRNTTTSGYDNIFSKLIKCEDCGYALRTSSANRRKRSEAIDNVGYYCNQYGTYGKKACSMHWIEARELHRVVLDDIRRHAKKAIASDEKMIGRIIKNLNSISVKDKNKLNQDLKNSKVRLSSIDNLFANLYEDRMKNELTERNFKMMSDKYQLEQDQLSQRILKIEEELKVDTVNYDNAKRFTELIKNYGGIEELNTPLLNNLIKRITVSEPEIVEDVKTQRVRIYYNFIGELKNI